MFVANLQFGRIAIKSTVQWAVVNIHIHSSSCANSFPTQGYIVCKLNGRFANLLVARVNLLNSPAAFIANYCPGHNMCHNYWSRDLWWARAQLQTKKANQFIGEWKRICIRIGRWDWINRFNTIYNHCTRGELTELLLLLLLLTDLEDNNCSMTQRKIPIQTRTILWPTTGPAATWQRILNILIEWMNRRMTLLCMTELGDWANEFRMTGHVCRLFLAHIHGFQFELY